MPPRTPHVRDLRRAKEPWPNTAVVGNCGDQSFGASTKIFREELHFELGEEFTNPYQHVEEVRECLRALNTNIFPVCSVHRRVRVWQLTTEDDHLGPGCLVQDAL